MIKVCGGAFIQGRMALMGLHRLMFRGQFCFASCIHMVVDRARMAFWGKWVNALN